MDSRSGMGEMIARKRGQRCEVRVKSGEELVAYRGETRLQVVKSTALLISLSEGPKGGT